MTRLGFEVVVARNLTDAMYDPRKRPFVSHARGTELESANQARRKANSPKAAACAAREAHSVRGAPGGLDMLESMKMTAAHARAGKRRSQDITSV